MKKYVLLVIALTTVLVAFTGCKKETTVASEPENQLVKVPMTFSASINGESKLRTELDGETHKITVWSEGDKIKIATEQTIRGEANEFTLTDGAGTAYGTFKGECEEGSVYLAAYPASLLLNKFIYSLPGVQKYVENGFAPNTVPLFSYSETKELNFINVTGMLRLGVKLKSGSDNIVVKSMILKDKQTYKKLWGHYTYNITFDGIEPIHGDESGDNTMTIDLGNGVELNSNSFTYFYFCLPKETLLEGFTVEMEDANGKVATIDYTGTDKKVEQNKGKTYEAADVEFVLPPTTGYADRKEGTGTVKVKWVQLWKDGPKWAEYNVGATSVGDYGGYYCWGMSKNQDPNEETYKGNEDIQGGDHDTAKNLWGSNWQMAKKEDLEYLFGKNGKTAKATRVWKTADTSGYGVAGYLCTGIEEGYTNNSVFFHASGYFLYGSINDRGGLGSTWSSTPIGEKAYHLYFFANGWNEGVNDDIRNSAQTVRAILAE